jgi:DNA-damage-inducible protein D
MTTDISVFHFDDARPSFENMARQNGFRFWLASDLMRILDYSTMPPILKAANKAMSACAQLNVAIGENFVETKTETGAKDWKLSRFACWLTVMNGDPKKPLVAQAQAYFITMAEAFRQQIQDSEAIERVVIRGEVTDRETALSATVHSRGIETIQFFQNAGYRGMYNLDLKQIRAKKGVPDGRSALDFMGSTELAANLFRITQTEEKIRNEDINGQRPLERAAEFVGKGVRQTMIDLSGVPPERLPPAQDIRKVRAAIKSTGKEYAKIDAVPRKPKKSA